MIKFSAFRVYPCLPASLWLITGIIIPVLPATTAAGWLPTVLYTAVIGSLAWIVTPRECRWLALLLPTGAMIGAMHLNPPRARYLDELAKTSRPVEIQAVITDSPYSGDELDWLSGKRGYFGQLKAVADDLHDHWHNVHGKILIQLPLTDQQNMEYGTRLKATGYFDTPNPALVPGEFDYRRFLHGRSVQWIFRIDSLIDVEQASGWRRLKRSLYRLRENTAVRLTRHLDDQQSASLLLAMTLGYREGINPRVRRAFVQSGIIHIFAISGLHVGIIAAFLLGFSKLCRLPYRWRYWMLPVFLGIYVLMTGAGPSAVRAWIMISLWSASKALLIPLLPINAVAAAALIILLFKPLQIIDLGFQFSFVIVTILITGWRTGKETVNALREKEYWIPRNSRTRSRRFFGLITQYTAALGTGSLIAWLGSFGLILFTQGLFIPGAMLLNVVVAIIAWMSLFFSILKIGFDLLIPWLPMAEICGSILHRCMRLLEWLAMIGGEKPFSFAMVRPWLPIVFLYYGMLLASLTGVQGRLQNWKRIMPGILAPLLLLTCALARQARQKPVLAVFWGDRTNIPVLALDYGVRLPPVIVNAGDYWTGQRIGTWVRSRGWDEVETLILTSRRRDQSAGLENIQEQTAPHTIVLPENWHQNQYLHRPVVTLLNYGGRLRLFSQQATRREPHFLFRQPALKVTMHRQDGVKKLNLQRNTLKGELKIHFVHQPNQGTRIVVETATKPKQQLHIPFSREPQWHELRLE